MCTGLKPDLHRACLENNHNNNNKTKNKGRKKHAIKLVTMYRHLTNVTTNLTNVTTILVVPDKKILTRVPIYICSRTRLSRFLNKPDSWVNITERRSINNYPAKRKLKFKKKEIQLDPFLFMFWHIFISSLKTLIMVLDFFLNIDWYKYLTWLYSQLNTLSSACIPVNGRSGTL